MEKKMTKKVWIIIICLFCLFTVGIIFGYKAFKNRDRKIVEKEEKGGTVVLNYATNFSGLTIVNAQKTADSIAIKDVTDGKYFDFSIAVDLEKAKNVEYEIFATKIAKDSTISDDDIRIYLEKENSGTYAQVLAPTKYSPLKKESELGSKKGSMVLTSEKKTKSSVDNYRLRVWLADTSLLETGNYSVTVSVVGKAS
ncbi:MAG: hypothetical protein IJI22_00500 [Bacilli bacterium]|nr:hypothetical protein [Bacilli bacterium]